MGTILMIITACAAGSLCRDFQVPLQAQITQRMCIQQGMIGLAEWSAEHPAYTIRSWRCEPAGVSAKS